MLTVSDGSPFSRREFVFLTLVLHIADLAHARAQELHSLLQELGQRQDKHRTALQILPRYMRRRAASYNIKRLPRSLRPLADPKTVNLAHQIHLLPTAFHLTGLSKKEASIASVPPSTSRSSLFVYQPSAKDQMASNSYLACQTLSHDHPVELSSGREVDHEMRPTHL